jgi:hypothetical protein
LKQDLGRLTAELSNIQAKKKLLGK